MPYYANAAFPSPGNQPAPSRKGLPGAGSLNFGGAVPTGETADAEGQGSGEEAGCAGGIF